jgi:hypothetical protein
MVSVFAIGPKFIGFIPALGDGFLRTIKIRSTPSFGGEVKSSAPCRKILKHVKMKKDTSMAKFIIYFSKFLLVCY